MTDVNYPTILGALDDAVSAGAITTTDTAVAYLKQLINAYRGTGGIENIALGVKLTRSAADIFDGTQKALYTVGSGRILLTHIEIEVTNANMDVTTANTNIVTNPTVGTDVDLCATTDITGDVIGTIYSPAGPIATAMQAGLGLVIGLSHKGYIIPEGTIDVVSSADAASSGGAQGKCEAWWIPIDAGATLVTA